MSAYDHFQRLEQMYQAAPVNRHFEPTLAVRKGEATLTMGVNPDFFHAARALHGSVYFKALDDAAFFAAASLEREFFVVTATFNIYLLRPVVEGVLRAEGKVVSRSRQHYVAESILFLDGDRQVARGSGSFMVSRTRLADVEAYRLPSEP